MTVARYAMKEGRILPLIFRYLFKMILFVTFRNSAGFLKLVFDKSQGKPKMPYELSVRSTFEG